MSYARKIEDVIAERDELRRWKSTHAPRIEALEGLLKHEQLEAHAGREAIATLASEREANSILTAELEQLRAMLMPLLLLAQEVRLIDAHGATPDGDGVNGPTALWAEDWTRRLAVATKEAQ